MLLDPRLSEKLVSGRLFGASQEQTFNALAFLLDAQYRSDEKAEVFMFGGSPQSSIVAFPTYGLEQGEFAAIVDGQSALVGDKIIVRGDQTQETQVRKVMDEFKDRRHLTIEILMIDIQSTDYDRMNEWLSHLSATGGYLARTAAQTVQPGGFGQQVAQNAFHGVQYNVDIEGIIALLDVFSSGSVELREQIQILSGSESTFSSGQVISTPLILREPQTGADLTTTIERRTVGLDLNVKATYFDGLWHLVLDIGDSSFQGTTELTTTLQTEKIIPGDSRATFQLASFTRDTISTEERAVPLLARIPAVGRAFKKSETVTRKRQVVVFGRLLGQRVLDKRVR